METSNEIKAYSIDEVVNTGPYGRTKVYSEIASGRLKAKKLGKRTLITTESLSDWLNSLPEIGEDK